MVENLLTMQETQFQSLDGEDLLEKEIALKKKQTKKKHKNTKSKGGCKSTGKLTHSGGSIRYYSHFGE